jgi:hypothetical protein
VLTPLCSPALGCDRSAVEAARTRERSVTLKRRDEVGSSNAARVAWTDEFRVNARSGP